MASTSEPQYPSEAEVIQWLNELDARQRMALRLYLVKKLKQTEAAAKLGMAQGSFSPYYNKTIGQLNGKSNAANRTNISEPALIAALSKIPESPQEQAELVGASIAGTRDEVVNNPPKTESGGLDEIQQNTAAQPVTAERPSTLRAWGLPLGALVVGLILGALAILSRSGSAAAPSPISDPQTISATVVVPETVIVRETVPVPETVVVEQTVLVPQTVVVEQTVMVPQTVIVTEAAPEARPTRDLSGLEPLIVSGETTTPQADTPEPVATATPAPPESAPVPGTVLFSDDFETGPNSTWQIESGDWNMRNGKLVNTGQRGMIWLGKQNWTDVVVDFDINNPVCNGETHVLVRMQDLNNYVGYYVIGCAQHRVYLVKDGQPVKDIVNVDSRAGHHRLEVIGNIYRVYQDGKVLGTGSDSTYKSGSAGILVDRDAQEIDNFKVAVPE